MIETITTTKRYTNFETYVDMIEFIDDKYPDLCLDKIYTGYNRKDKHYFEIKEVKEWINF